MDGLAEFENSLAREKSEREKESRKKDRSHRHHHREHHRSESSSKRHGDGGSSSKDADRHRHRSRHARVHESDDDKDSGSSHRQKRQKSDRDAESVDKEGETKTSESLVRDAWMTAPSALDIDYVHRRREEKMQPKSAPRHLIAEKELNKEALQSINSGKSIDELDVSVQTTTESYQFGDEGSQWRMTKLNGVYTVAEQSGRPVEEVAEERFGSLQAFDEAREEKRELERRRQYGKGYVGPETPTGELYRERLARNPKPAREEETKAELPPAQPRESQPPAAPVDQTTLNRMRAQLLKAKMRNAPDVAKLEAEYAAAMAGTSSSRGAEQAVVLDAASSRLLAGQRGEVKAVDTRRGRERGQVQANEDMSIADMVREERRTRGAQGGEGLRLAERIAKDAKFDDDLEYLDENAEKLAQRTHKSEASLKHIAVAEYTKMNKILETCPLCHHEDRPAPQDQPLAPVVSLATRVFLTLPTAPELTGAEGGAVLVPIEHHTNLLECSDDEWEELRNFMKALTRLYHEQGRDVVFYENAAAPQRRQHAALVAVPIPYELGATAPAFFKDAMLSADEEWSQHKKIIDTGKRAREGLGRQAFRKSIAKEMPYFHVWFTLDGGLGHVVEDAGRWPRGDLFAREIVGGMLDVDPTIIKRQGRWTRPDGRVEEFQKRWRKFDWTRVLAEG